MITPPKKSIPSGLDELTAFPFAMKDTLRGLRRSLFDFPKDLPVSTIDEPPQSPMALAQLLIHKTRKVAALGEGLARDILLRHRDEARILAFAGSGFTASTKGDDEAKRRTFVTSRYSAAKFVLFHFGYSGTLVLEQPIDNVWRTLSDRFTAETDPDHRQDGSNFYRLAAAAIALAACGSISQPTTPECEQSLAFLTFASVGLAEAVLSVSHYHSYETTLAALELSADVMRLRKASLASILNGFDPEGQLAAEYQLLASALAET